MSRKCSRRRVREIFMQRNFSVLQYVKNCLKSTNGLPSTADLKELIKSVGVVAISNINLDNLDCSFYDNTPNAQL